MKESEAAPSATSRANKSKQSSIKTEIRRLLERHGIEAVRAEVALQTRKRSGPNKIDDWPLLWPLLRQDVDEWLAGGELCKARSDHAVANAFALEKPGHNPSSTVTRISRKLKEKNSRKVYVLVQALVESRDGHPYAVHLRTLEALCSLVPNSRRWEWELFLETANRSLASFESKHGRPADTLSIAEIEADLRPQSPLREGLLAMNAARQRS